MKKEFTLTIKTNCGLLTWSVFAKDEIEAKEIALKELLKEFEIGGYKAIETKQEEIERG